MVTKKVMKEVKVWTCDYCEKEAIEVCAHCGKDMCELHTGDFDDSNTDDGDLCKKCEKEGFAIHYEDDGGVSLYKNGKEYKGKTNF